MLALGALVGVWLVLTGFRLVLETLTRRDAHRATAPLWRRRQAPHVALAAVSLAVALVLAWVGARLVGTQTPDAFYTPPAEIPSEPGTLLRAEPFTRAMPPGTTAWRILYTTTRDDGTPALASGLVIVPDGVDDAPVLAWAHGTTGAAVGCAPTLLDEPLASGAMPNTEAAITAGWAIVATDYVGLGASAPHPYLVGRAEAHSVLDAVRAAHQVQGASLGEQTVVWGHSQGGGAALWTGGVAESYAPEIDLVGVAAIAPAADLPAMIGALAEEKSGTVIGPLVLAGYASTYDDVRVSDYLRPEATLLFDETVARCWSDPAMLVTVIGAVLVDRPIWAANPTEGPLGARLEQNVPLLPIHAPLLIAQGLTDPLVLPDAQQDYVDSLCRSGQSVDYRTYEGQGHVEVVSPGSALLDELMQWTRDRLAGEPAASTCPPR